jgi:hypothetical protein
LLEARADLKTDAAVREQLEERLRAAEHPATERASTTRAPSRHARQAEPPFRAGES